jgi:hypothetical protein
MRKPEKIAVTRDAVLNAFAEGRTFAHRPLGITDIARNIAEAHDAWQEPFTVISRATLVRVLHEVTGDGALVVRTGTQWFMEGVGFHDRRPSVRYWTTRERAEGWARTRAEEKRSAEEKQQAEEADQYAKGFLVERHREEYDALVAEYYTEREREQNR